MFDGTYKGSDPNKGGHGKKPPPKGKGSLGVIRVIRCHRGEREPTGLDGKPKQNNENECNKLKRP